MDESIYEQITKKKEFSHLSKIDVEVAFSHFEKRQVSEVERIRLTRELLHKVFGAFLSSKLLNKKIIDKKTVEEILQKHISTKERFEFYPELYNHIFDSKDGEVKIIDLGAGINGLSYNFIRQSLTIPPSTSPTTHPKINYVGIESVGQLVDLMNKFFIEGKIKNAKAIHLSLFELEKLKKLISEQKGKKFIFLFKVIDSLEMLERDYSKKLLKEIVNLPDVEKVVVSFATRSLISKKNFKVKRYWFENFVKEEFNILDTFELGGEKYFVLGKKIC